MASVGILALSLWVPPTDTQGAGTAAPVVRLAVFELSPAVQWRTLEEFVSRARAVVPVTNAAGVDAADIPAVVGMPPTVVATSKQIDSDPDATRLTADAAALSPATLVSLMPASLLPIIGPIILFAPAILLVVLACPPCALVNFLSFAISSLLIPIAPLSAVSVEPAVPEEAEPIATTSMASDREAIGSARITEDPVETAGAESKDTVETVRDTGQVTEPDPLAGREIESMRTDTAPAGESTSVVTEDVDTREAEESDLEATTTETDAGHAKPTGGTPGGGDTETDESTSPKPAAAASSFGDDSAGGDSPDGDDGSS